MKILVINWQDIRNPLGGGAEVHCHEIFRRIAAMGHSVTQFSCGFEGASLSEDVDGIHIERSGSRNDFNLHVPLAYYRKYRHEGFDIVIDDINKIPFYTPLYVCEPLLAISHHFFGKSIFRETDFVRGSYVFLSEKLVDIVYRKTRFAVVSQSTLDEFIARGFELINFSIIRNAIDHTKFPMRLQEKEDQPTIAYFSRIKKYKSPDHLLRAFAEVIKKMPLAKLWFIGTGDYVPQLQRLALDLGVSSSVVFHGRVSEDEKIRLLSRAWCIVNTSMKEGWGITNIEANACGTPAIAANVPGLRDSVREFQSGLLYTYGDIAQLSDKISSLLLDPALLQNLSNGAIEWSKCFSWDDSATQMLDLCKEIIDLRRTIR